MKIALVHDSFTQLGGAERVVDILHEMFPEAPVFCLVMDFRLKDKYKDWDIRTSPLQILYDALPRLQYLLPLIPWAVEQLDFTGFDLVISSSSGFVKNIRLPKNALHINYCHTPPRFLWTDKDYVKQEVPFFLRPLAKWVLSKMKQWDLQGSNRVGFFIANSVEVQKRIKNIYGRESQVVYPSIDTNFWRPAAPKQGYFLIAGRLQAHKHNELILNIFNELGLPLKVIGTGRQENYLHSIAKKNIEFLGRVTDEELRAAYSGARAFIFPQIEDFGLMPLEAAACGTATLAYAQGGALETVVEGVTGEFFKSYDEQAIKRLILNWQDNRYQTYKLLEHAAKFSKQNFTNRISSQIQAHFKTDNQTG